MAESESRDPVEPAPPAEARGAAEALAIDRAFRGRESDAILAEVVRAAKEYFRTRRTPPRASP